MAVSRKTVIRAFTFFLGRKPGREDAIRAHMRAAGDETALAEIPIGSQAFRSKNRFSNLVELKKGSLSTYSRQNRAASRLKIAVVGNCQALAWARCMEAVTREVSATGMELSRMIRSANWQEAEFLPVLSNNDVVFIHPHPYMGELTETKNKHMRSKIRIIPPIAFSAFHPDLVYIAKPGGIFSGGPLGDYNSSLALYGWMSGMSVSQTVQLFTDEVYQKLGFYDYWDSSKDALLKIGKDSGLPLDILFDSWTRQGCFMHSINHPKQFVIADLARAILNQLGISTIPGAEQFIHDHFSDGPVWPVYPEVGRRLGIEGNYLFKMPLGVGDGGNPVMLDLEEFVGGCHRAFSHYRKQDLICERLNSEPYRELDTFLNGRRMAGSLAFAPMKPAESEPATPGENPYDGLPGYQFWRKAIGNVALREVDPVVSSGFIIDRQTKIATAGSCFAQHLSRTLEQCGFNYYIAEKPAGLSSEEAARLNYGVFSARYGNIYTVRQLLQLFDRAYGSFQPADSAWARGDGRYADPFRPQIEPSGFETTEAVEEDRSAHLSAVRHMFETLDVLVFTLGLTEAWAAKEDGAVFPLAPGVAAGKMDFTRYEFVNFGVNEVISDLEAFIERLREVNRGARIILTVSPVPLIATYENRHVLVSTTYSKSVLRVAAEEIVRRHSNCVYFPSYEIITGNYTRGIYYDADLRSVNAAGVDHVMRLFLAHYSAHKEKSTLYNELMREAESVMEVICDEEAIDAAI
jgi:hypothetical protein